MAKSRLLAEHVRGERERAEQAEDGAIAHVEPAGIGAERRHDQAAAIAGEAAPAHRAAALRHPRDRMQMARDLAVAAPARTARGERSAGRTPTHRRSGRRYRPEDRDRGCRRSRSNRGRAGALSARRDRCPTCAMGHGRRESCRPKRPRDAARSAQRGARAAPKSLRCRKAAAARRAWQRLSLFPDADRRRASRLSSGQYSAPAGIGDKRDASDGDRAGLRRTHKLRIAAGAGLSGRSGTPHCIASFTSSASASARSVSDASP